MVLRLVRVSVLRTAVKASLSRPTLQWCQQVGAKPATLGRRQGPDDLPLVDSPGVFCVKYKWTASNKRFSSWYRSEVYCLPRLCEQPR